MLLQFMLVKGDRLSFFDGFGPFRGSFFDGVNQKALHSLVLRVLGRIKLKYLYAINKRYYKVLHRSRFFNKDLFVNKSVVFKWLKSYTEGFFITPIFLPKLCHSKGFFSLLNFNQLNDGRSSVRFLRQSLKYLQL